MVTVDQHEQMLADFVKRSYADGHDLKEIQQKMAEIFGVAVNADELERMLNL